MGGWGWHDGPDGWGWIWMSLMMLLVWLPLIVVAVWAVSQIGRRSGREGDGADAREIARRRYAQGEIDRERYLQIMEDIERGHVQR